MVKFNPIFQTSSSNTPFSGFSLRLVAKTHTAAAPPPDDNEYVCFVFYLHVIEKKEKAGSRIRTDSNKSGTLESVPDLFH